MPMLEIVERERKSRIVARGITLRKGGVTLTQRDAILKIPLDPPPPPER